MADEVKVTEPGVMPETPEAPSLSSTEDEQDFAAEAEALDVAPEVDAEAPAATEAPAEPAKATEPATAATKLADLAAEQPAPAPEAAQEAAPKAAADPAPAAEKPDAETKPAAAPAEPTDFKALVESFAGSKDFEDMTFTMKGDNGEESESTVAQFIKDFPDFSHSAIAIADKMAKATIQKMLDSGELLTGDQFNAVRTELVNMRFDNQISRKHPDWRDLVENDATPFRKWVGTLPSEQQRLFTSSRVQDAIGLIDAFREHEAAAVAKAAGSKVKAIAAKARGDSLHGDGLAGGGAGAGSGNGGLAGGASEDEMFEAEAKRQDAEDRRERR